MSANRLTAVGDSFVVGWGDPLPGARLRGWVPRLADLLGLPAGSVRNHGMHGATADYVATFLVRHVRLGRAPLAGVIVGMRDLLCDYEPARFRRNLCDILSSLAGTSATVLTANYPDIPRSLRLPDNTQRLLRDRFAEASAALDEIACATGALCVDLRGAPEWRGPAMWSRDGIHPGPQGHQYIAEQMAELVINTSTSLVAA